MAFGRVCEGQPPVRGPSRKKVLGSLYGTATTEPGDGRSFDPQPVASDPVKPLPSAVTGPIAAVAVALIPRPEIVIDSTLRGSDATMLIISTLGAASVTVAPNDPGATSVGVPTKAIVEASPSRSASVTRNDPGAFRRASSRISRNLSTTVAAELESREIKPTLTTSGASRTGPEYGVALGDGTGVGDRLILIEGLGSGGAGRYNVATATMIARARAATRTAATTARNVVSLIRS